MILADSAGYLEKQKLLSKISDFLKFLLTGKRTVGADLKLGVASEAAIVGPVEITRVRRVSVPDRLDDLERDIARVEKSIEALGKNVTAGLKTVKKRVNQDVADVRNELTGLRSKIESETDKFVKIELAGILMFTHGLIVSWLISN